MSYETISMGKIDRTYMVEGEDVLVIVLPVKDLVRMISARSPLCYVVRSIY